MAAPILGGTPTTPPGAAVAGRPVDATASVVMLLLCLTWSLQQISLKAVSASVSPLMMVAMRSAIALLLLAALMGWRGERLQRAHVPAGTAVGALFGLEFLLVTEALRLTAASHVVVFLYTAPVFAALGLHLRLPAERLGRPQAVGILLAFGGIAWAFLGGRDGALAATGHREQALLGDALALLAGVTWGATTVTLRGSRLASAPATEMLAYQLLGAVLLLLPVAALSGRWRFEPTTVVWAHLAFQSLVVSLASFLAWCWLLRRYLASRLGVFSFLTPLFGVLLGAWLLGEPLEAAFVAGSVLVLAGIGLVSAPTQGPARPVRRGQASLLADQWVIQAARKVAKPSAAGERARVDGV